MQLTPGYDFATTEVPTRAKLGLQASGMTISDIQLSQVDLSLQVMLVTDGSLTSLTEGSLWTDGRSNIWGRTSHGQIRVRMSEGGWETHRYPFYNNSTGSNFTVPGMPVDTISILPNNTNESTCAFFCRIGATINQYLVGVNQETVNSMATNSAGAYYRVVGRGATRVYSPTGFPPSAGVHRLKAVYSSGWSVSNHDTGAIDGPRFWECAQGDTDGDPANYGYGYFFNLTNLT